MARKQTSEFPYLLEDRTGTIPQACPIVAVGESFEAVRVVHKDLWPEVKIRDHAIVRAHIAADREASTKENSIYYKVGATEAELQKAITHLGYMALEYSATPEAIRLLDQFVAFNAKEKKIMAEKLKAKASAAKPAKKSAKSADAAGLKAAANEAPVSSKKGGRKGNAEALAKARAARSSGPDTRKVKALVKKGDLKARAGTFRRQMLEDLLASKTVQDFRDKNPKYDAACVSWAQKEGFVAYS